MLALTRGEGESITIYAGEKKITVTVVEVRAGRQVRLSFEAPNDIDIYRTEVLDREEDAK